MQIKWHKYLDLCRLILTDNSNKPQFILFQELCNTQCKQWSYHNPICQRGKIDKGSEEERRGKADIYVPT